MRLVAPSDSFAIVEMLRLLRQESPAYNYVSDDPEWVYDNLYALIQAEQMFGFIEPDKGFMIGSISHTWYSKRMEAVEHLLYIDPDQRGGMLAIRLIKSFEAYARERGATILHTGASTRMMEDRTTKLYMRLGFEPTGQTLRKQL